MKDGVLRPQPFDQPDHFALKRKAYEYFLHETSDPAEAAKMANIVFNIVVLKSSYSAGIQAKVDKFLHSNGELEDSL
jgi:hypothetical protein